MERGFTPMQAIVAATKTSSEALQIDKHVGTLYAMVQTPDGHGRLELVKFHSPSARSGDGHAPANILGIRHVAFVVDDIDAAVATVRARGGELVGEVENYQDIYRLCYVRGPEGIIVELAQRIG